MAAFHSVGTKHSKVNTLLWQIAVVKVDNFDCLNFLKISRVSFTMLPQRGSKNNRLVHGVNSNFINENIFTRTTAVR